MSVVDWHGRVVLVTGAGGGIGSAVALASASRSAVVLAADLRGEAAAVTADACRAAGAPAASAYEVDVADRDAMTELASRVHAEHGPLDVLVNNAGVGLSGTLLDTSLDDWDWILGVNFLGVLHGCRLFGPSMVERGRGHVVNVSSMMAFLPTPDQPAYCATKAAVLSLSRSLRADWRSQGVGVTAVCPGVVRTGIAARSRFRGADAAEDRTWAQAFAARSHPPEKVARAVLHGVDDDRGLVVVTPEARATYLLSRLVPNGLGAAAARLRQIDRRRRARARARADAR